MPSPFFYLLILRSNKMQTICVTGGIAMGKTTVMNTLSELFPEAVFFDADKVVSGLLTTTDFRVKLRGIFGDESLTESGEINRTYIREQIFDSAEQRVKLENITHPEVKKEYIKIRQQAVTDNRKHLFADIPLFYETSSRYEFDYILVVATDAETQLERLKDRPGMNHQMALNIINAQMEIKKKIDLSDKVIWNCGNQYQLNKQINYFVSWLKTMN